jgi:hypothetical protein
LTLGVLAALAGSSASSSSSINNVEPGVLGFLVVAGMGVILVFLLRSMNKQFHKITPPAGSADDRADDRADDQEAKDPAQVAE